LESLIAKVSGSTLKAGVPAKNDVDDMTNQANITSGPSLLGEALLGEIRRVIREEVNSAGAKHELSEDRLLTADEAAQILSVSPDWLYRNAKKLPFTRKLGPKMLRFSYQGMLKWLESRKFH
jgi:predicted DNA-binding transcriptional regulator AlpA